jgi:hypothetical protein
MKIFIVGVFPHIATGTRTQITGTYYVTRISVLNPNYNSTQSLSVLGSSLEKQ